MYVENKSKRSVGIESIRIAPGAIAKLESTKDSHKGLKTALDKGWLVETTEKEFRAFSDPAGVAAELAEEAEKKAEKKDAK